MFFFCPRRRLHSTSHSPEVSEQSEHCKVVKRVAREEEKKRVFISLCESVREGRRRQGDRRDCVCASGAARGGDAMAQEESEKEARRKDVGREKGWREVGKGDGDLLSVAEQGLEELGWR